MEIKWNEEKIDVTKACALRTYSAPTNNTVMNYYWVYVQCGK